MVVTVERRSWTWHRLIEKLISLVGSANVTNDQDSKATEEEGESADLDKVSEMSNFEKIVQLNRSVGIDPSRSEPAGSPVYVSAHLVPMSGDTFWGAGRTISHAQIERRFKRLKI
jgi:hypothetical protein